LESRTSSCQYLSPSVDVAWVDGCLGIAHLESLGIYPSSIQFDTIAHLESLGIHFYILDEEEEEAFEHNHYWLTFLRRYEHICSLDLMISYPSVSPSSCHHCSVSMYWVEFQWSGFLKLLPEIPYCLELGELAPWTTR
jgi:hypothetical protein